MNISFKSKKIISAGLLMALLAGSIYFTDSSSVVQVNAAKDTLSTIDDIRSGVIDAGDSFHIIEVVPDKRCAELGYYIGGSEPFDVLLSSDSATGVVDWRTKLSYLKTAAERKFFMDTLIAQAENVLSYMGISSGDASAPFSVSYTEYEGTGAPSDIDNWRAVDVNGENIRGYVEYLGYADPNANWTAIFDHVSDTSTLSLDDVNNGTDLVYYTATPVQENLTYPQLRDLATGTSYKIPIYEWYNDSYYIYVGTAEEVWNQDRGYVSANDGSTNPTNYATVKFTHINQNPSNQITVGTEIYTFNKNKSYVNVSTGEYQFVNTEEGVAGDSVNTSYTFYYQGGLINQDAFISTVFGIEDENFSIVVEPLTVEELNQKDASYFDSVDMVSIVGSGVSRSLYNAPSTANPNPENPVYSYQQDISQAVLNALATRAYNSFLPIMFDVKDLYSDASSDGISNTLPKNLSVLASYLMLNKENGEGGSVKKDFLQADDTIDLSAYAASWNASLLKHTYLQKDCNFVQEATWFYNSDYRPVLASGLLQDVLYYSESITDGNGNVVPVSGGLKPVLDLIEEENLYREADISKQPLSTDIYDWTIIRHIIAYNSNSGIIKDHLEVLILQPATDGYGVSNYNTWLNSLRSVLADKTGVASDNISFTTQPMNYFIGKVVDLNASYDIIYIGSSPRGFNLNDNGTTVFNDSNMNGLVYSHVGDTYSNTVTNASLDNEYYTQGGNTFISKNPIVSRFSGNDLTLEAYNSLIDFIMGSYPVIIDDGLLENAKTVRKDRVDSSSYMYEFLKTAVSMKTVNNGGGAVETNEKMYKSVFAYSELTGSNGYTDRSTLFRFYANRAKLQIVAQDDYGLYILPTLETRNGQLAPKYYANDQGTNNKILYVDYDAASDSCKLSFKFSIANLGSLTNSDRYAVHLYIDSNADGKFSALEDQGAVTVLDNEDGPTTLRRNKTYTIEKNVPNDFIGCLTYKLTVEQANNPYIRSSVIGYAKSTKVPTREERTIDILQVHMGDTYTGNGWNRALNGDVINLEQSIGHDNGNGYTIGTSAVTNYFHECAEDVYDDFILNVTTVGQDFDPNAYPYQNYDMLILGFSDAIDGSDFSDAKIAYFQEFIDSGKSVLFAHDMASFMMMPMNSTYYNGTGIYSGMWTWGYRMNRGVRSLVGMDPYSMLADGALRSGNGYSVVNGVLNGTGLSIPQKNADGKYSYDSYNYAFTPKDDQNSTVGQTHGWAAYHMMAKQSSNSEYRYRSNSVNNARQCRTRAVEQVNAGQITTFPYDLNGLSISQPSYGNSTTSGFQVGDTHNQYYFLDMYGDTDGDNQADIVVWYNIFDRGDDFIYSGYGVDGNDARDDELASGDVLNNYYLYSKGNILYTGMGHHADADQANAVTKNEAKLFINAMIASYNSGKHDPILNTYADASKSVVTSSYLGFYDESNSLSFDSESRESIDVYFDIKDLNLRGTRTGEIRFFVEDSTQSGYYNLDTDTYDPSYSTSASTVDGDVKVRKLSLSVVKADGSGADSGSLEVNTSYAYKVTVPLSVFLVTDADGNQRFDFSKKFYLAARDVVRQPKVLDPSQYNTFYTGWTKASVTYSAVELFDLD